MEHARLLKDRILSKIMLILTVLPGIIIFLMVSGLYFKSRPILALESLPDLLFSSSWHPLRGEFGFFPFIMSTIWVTAVAVIIAIPLSLLTSIFLSEYAHKNVRKWIKPFVDLLAGIPSVVFGVWGILLIVPLIKCFIAPLFGVLTTGYCVLTAGVILAIMTFPVIIHVSLEVFRAVPNELREASLAVGATKWQTVKHVVMRKAMPGIIAAIVLGFSRAFGETMAVLMVAGNVAETPSSVFKPAYPLPALIANNYGEMLSVPLYDSALLLSALVLLLVVLVFNIAARLVLLRVEKGLG